MKKILFTLLIAALANAEDLNNKLIETIKIDETEIQVLCIRNFVFFKEKNSGTLTQFNVKTFGNDSVPAPCDMYEKTYITKK